MSAADKLVERGDVGDDDDDSASADGAALLGELLFVFDCRIRGVQYYRGQVSNGQSVDLVREPDNPYDRHAIRVENIVGEKVGHIERDVAALLSPLLEDQRVAAEGVVLNGAGNRYDVPLSIAVFGQRAERHALQSKFRLYRPRAELGAHAATNDVRTATATAATAAAAERRRRLLVPNGEQRQVDAVLDALQRGGDAQRGVAGPRADTPRALRTPLFAHQQIFLAWAREREESALGDAALVSFRQMKDGRWQNVMTNTIVATRPTPARGAILADDMGLGKTLQTLSVIVDDIERTSHNKPTLVIAPVAAIDIWRRQAAEHIDDSALPNGFETLMYVGPGRKKLKVADLQRVPVVITSYGTLRTHFRKRNPDKPNSADRGLGPLFGIKWRRIVLDEAHSIKNRNSVTCRAACLLDAERHWCLTGTPIQNALEDFYSLLHFMRVAPFDKFQWFTTLIMRPLKRNDGDAYARLQALVRALVMRRLKSTKIDNRPIVEVPPAHSHVVSVPLVGRARSIYRALFKAARREVNELRLAGRDDLILANYSNILVILLRLRQACVHVSLLPKKWADDAAAAARALFAQFKPSDDQIETINRGAERMRELLAGQGNDNSPLDCCICMDDMQEPVVTACGHHFCRDCVVRAIGALPRCPMCRADISERELVAVNIEEGEVKVELPGKNDAMEQDVHVKIEALLQMIDATSSMPRAERKCVIFSQFPSIFASVREQLEQRGLRVGVIEGKVPQPVRLELIDQFRESADPSTALDVMCVSLRAGGVGIDLSAGRFVYLLDNWWNVATEEQAIARVHRLGLKRPVHVQRIVAADSIEENIIVLQRKKKLTVAEAFGTKSNDQLRKERLEIVYNLFGDPQAPPGAESLDQRVKELRGLAEYGHRGADLRYNLDSRLASTAAVDVDAADSEELLAPVDMSSAQKKKKEEAREIKDANDDDGSGDDSAALLAKDEELARTLSAQFAREAEEEDAERAGVAREDSQVLHIGNNADADVDDDDDDDDVDAAHNRKDKVVLDLVNIDDDADNSEPAPIKKQKKVPKRKLRAAAAKDNGVDENDDPTDEQSVAKRPRRSSRRRIEKTLTEDFVAP